MGLPKRKPTEFFEVGKFICPATQSLVPLMATCSLAFLDWPVVVEHCPGCGQRHVVRCEDVEHPPVFGYE